MSGKKYVATKRVPLSNTGLHGYDEECYAIVRPATFQTLRGWNDFLKSKPGDEQSAEYQENLVDEHFIGGKVKVTENGEDFELVPLTAELVKESPDISNVLAAAIMGWDLDPKDIQKAVQKSVTPSNDDESTKTSTSED